MLLSPDESVLCNRRNLDTFHNQAGRKGRRSEKPTLTWDERRPSKFDLHSESIDENLEIHGLRFWSVRAERHTNTGRLNNPRCDDGTGINSSALNPSHLGLYTVRAANVTFIEIQDRPPPIKSTRLLDSIAHHHRPYHFHCRPYRLLSVH